MENNDKLHKNIKFYKTKYECVYIKDNYKRTVYIGKSGCKNQKFIKNIRIQGLKNFSMITLEIGGQKIDRIYGFMYDTIAKRYGLPKTENTVYLPYDIIPYPQEHEVKLHVCTDYNSGYEDKCCKDHRESEYEIMVLYDVYLYDQDEDPLKLKETGPRKFRFPQGIIYNEQLINQVQYHGPELVDSKEYKLRLNYNHIVNTIAMNVPEGIDKNVEIFFGMSKDNVITTKLPLSYRVGEFAVYEIPDINFSMVDRCQLIIEDTTDMKTDDNGEKKLHVFAFNKQILIFCNEVCALLFSK
jgi:hypothetical protein